MNAAWPDAGHTLLDPPARSTASSGGAAFEDGDAGRRRPATAADTPTTTTTRRKATRAQRIRTAGVVVRSGLLWVMPPFNGAPRCGHVCAFRYADETRRLVASERARVDRRGRALHGRGHPRR